LNITEVRVKLMHHRSDRLRAFCSITVDDDFVVHDLRVIEGRKGYFVAMPSRKLSSSCPKCGAKNPLRAKFCNECGAPQNQSSAVLEREAHDKLHVDVAHPINTECREMLQREVLEAYEQEEKRAAQGLAKADADAGGDLDDMLDDHVTAGEDDEDDADAPDIGTDYEPVPAISTGDEPVPAIGNDYEPAPVVDAEYEREEPAIDTDYAPEPVIDTGYEPAPVIDTDYEPEPVTQDEPEDDVRTEPVPEAPTSEPEESRPPQEDLRPTAAQGRKQKKPKDSGAFGEGIL